MLLDGVPVDVLDMLCIVLGVADPMIRKTALPDFGIRPQFLFRSKRRAALDELNSPFQRNEWRDQQMKMIGHEDEFVKEIRIAAICQQGFEEQPCPRLGTEQGPAFPRLRCDEVCLRVVGCVLACGFQNHPSAAKAAVFVWRFCGTAEAVPFQNYPRSVCGTAEAVPFQNYPLHSVSTSFRIVPFRAVE